MPSWLPLRPCPLPSPTHLLQGKEKELADKEAALASTQDRVDALEKDMEMKTRMLQGISQVRLGWVMRYRWEGRWVEALDVMACGNMEILYEPLCNLAHHLSRSMSSCPLCHLLPCRWQHTWPAAEAMQQLQPPGPVRGAAGLQQGAVLTVHAAPRRSPSG